MEDQFYIVVEGGRVRVELGGATGTDSSIPFVKDWLNMEPLYVRPFKSSSSCCVCVCVCMCAGCVCVCMCAVCVCVCVCVWVGVVWVGVVCTCEGMQQSLLKEQGVETLQKSLNTLFLIATILSGICDPSTYLSHFPGDNHDQAEREGQDREAIPCQETHNVLASLVTAWLPVERHYRWG